jgi:hypothetical protein
MQPETQYLKKNVWMVNCKPRYLRHLDIKSEGEDGGIAILFSVGH